jgi:NADPH-dependent 2,4-dienoyl-CoA reductase/sulfur reductase-like enzyme/peroxiredoxin family protein/TusA-related sulfurtransferase/rhodanese-related sulfurtransferase
MGRKVLIVGGVAGGASAAARLRRLDETAEIIMFERDEYISFANCGLPYYIGGSIDDRSKLLVQTPQGMKDRYGIDVRINSEVVAVNTDKKTIQVNSKKNGLYEESYDALILSPGAKAIKPNIPGIQSEKIFTLRNILDTDKIKAYVDRKEITSALVIGGGFVGVEMAENLRERGISVTLVEAAPHILAPFDTDIVLEAEKEMKNNGVQLVLGDGVKAFREIGQQVEVTLNSDRMVLADLVILAIGVTPDTQFLKESGIELGARGHILVNDRLETNKEGIYAVGDAIEVVDYVTGNKTAIPLAGPANKQGRIAADNVAGLDSKYLGTQGTSVIKVFDMTLACTGANERTLKKADRFYNSIIIHPVSHASYYPGAVPMSLKLLFDREGKVLGAQAAGYEGVEKRIDVIATVLHLKGTVNHLAELELSYAPPYSSAKDPVNMAGFSAQNVLEGRSHIVTWEQIEALEESTYELIDVRSELEYENGHIQGAKNIPLDSLRVRLTELDKNKTIVEYCQVGLRGYVADRILTQHGFKVLNVTGGYRSAYDSLLEVPQQSRLIAASLGVADQSVIMLDPDTQTLKEEKEMQPDKILDACGLCCPGPLLKLKTSMDEMKEGEILKVIATDPGFYEDIKAWSKRTNTDLLDLNKEAGIITAHLRKEATVNQSRDMENKAVSAKDNKTMVVFSGDLDKAIASFIIANGAASMGKKVTMFFTFWGLNILRKPDKQKVSKGFLDRMFGMMMPRGSKKLKLSNMNMMGMGGKMIRMVMKNKKISSLEELIQFAIDSGIEIVACQMSMDVMGLKQEELLDGVKIGGVGYYLGEAEDSNVNLFI